MLNETRSWSLPLVVKDLTSITDNLWLNWGLLSPLAVTLCPRLMKLFSLNKLSGSADTGKV